MHYFEQLGTKLVSSIYLSHRLYLIFPIPLLLIHPILNLILSLSLSTFPPLLTLTPILTLIIPIILTIAKTMSWHYIDFSSSIDLYPWMCICP